jgi:hypothetical protein
LEEKVRTAGVLLLLFGGQRKRIDVFGSGNAPATLYELVGELGHGWDDTLVHPRMR